MIQISAFRFPARSGDGKRASSAIEVEGQAARPLGEGLGGGASGGLGEVSGIQPPGAIESSFFGRFYR